MPDRGAKAAIDTLFCLFQPRISFLLDPDVTATGRDSNGLDLHNLGFALLLRGLRLEDWRHQQIGYLFLLLFRCALLFQALILAPVAYLSCSVRRRGTVPSLPASRFQYPSTAPWVLLEAEAKLDTSLFMQATTLEAPLPPRRHLLALFSEHSRKGHKTHHSSIFRGSPVCFLSCTV